MKTVFFTFSLVVILWNFIFAQYDILDVQTSGNYYWGKGSGTTLQDAKEFAKSELLNGIISFIVAEQINVKEESNKSGINDLYRAYSRSFAKLRLKNLELIELPKRDDLFEALAFVSRSDFKESVAQLEKELREYVQFIGKREEKQGIAQSINEYYSAYLRTFYLPDPVSYVTEKKDTVANLRAFLEEKIRAYLHGIRLIPGKLRRTPNIQEQIEIPVSLQSAAGIADGMTVRLDVVDNPERKVYRGEAAVLQYNQPADRVQHHWFLLSPECLAGEELELHKRFGISERTQLPIDYSSVIKLDFEIQDEGGGVISFHPVINHLSISAVSWDFGDGANSSEMTPRHLYSTGGSYTVTLKVNNTDLLTVKKRLDGKPVPITPPMPEEKTDNKKVNRKPEHRRTGAITDVILRFSAGQSLEQISEILNELKTEGKIVYGKRSSFSRADDCYALIVAPEEKTLIALLEPGRTARTEIFSSKQISDVTTAYKGMVIIYFEIQR